MEKRIHKTALALFGGAAMGLVLLSLLTTTGTPGAQAAPRVIYVAADCTAAPSPCYHHIQTALIAADPGDEIRIAGGTYTDFYSTYVARVEKSLTLRGGYTDDFSQRDTDAYPTILDAEGQKRAIYIGTYTGETITVTLDGLRFVHGNADGLGGEEYTSNDVGGGIYATDAHLFLLNCHITDNRADQGGGIYLSTSANSVISNTRIYSNAAVRLDGGGMYIGTWDDLPLVIQGSIISGNMAYSMGGGGLISDLVMSNTLVYGNVSAWGGGGLLATGMITLNGNRFLHNGTGGGLSCRNCRGQVSNNIFADNADYGLTSIGGTLDLLHNTFADNDGNGLQVINSGQFEGHVTATNTIIAGNEIGVKVNGGASALLDATLWWGNGTNTYIGKTGNEHLDIGTHNYTADPAFADAAEGDYHLRPTSAAIDKGLAAGVNSDIDGDPRPWGAAPDLGADEYLPQPPSAVTISGPPYGLTNGSVTLIATVSPATAMLPITYTWQATGQPSATHVVSDTVDRMAFTWGVTGTNFYPVTGTKHITVTASNGYGEPVRGFHTVIIKAGREHIYLPTVIRGK